MADVNSVRSHAEQVGTCVAASGPRRRFRNMFRFVTLMLHGLIVLTLVAWTLADSTTPDRQSPSHDLSATARDDAVGSPTQYSVAINQPAGPPRVATGEFDLQGRPVTVSCASCHANLSPNSRSNSGEKLTEFHQGLAFHHGQLTCLSCHHADNYNRLRLADGRPIDFERVQTLCSQCHAGQARDYVHGAHGGMQGYWDLTRGPRERKNCVDCHDPHTPAFPRMIPSFRPQDRFLSNIRDETHHE